MQRLSLHIAIVLGPQDELGMCAGMILTTETTTIRNRGAGPS